MKPIHLIVVGKLKDKHLETIETSYLSRLSSPQLMIHEVKAKAENKDLEAKEISKKITEICQGTTYRLILLAENGKEYNSIQFSSWLREAQSQTNKLICVIAGAEGHSDSMLQAANEKISLSKLTFPHKIARILFVEQVYRAQTIQNNHPYHN